MLHLDGTLTNVPRYLSLPRRLFHSIFEYQDQDKKKSWSRHPTIDWLLWLLTTNVPFIEADQLFGEIAKNFPWCFIIACLLPNFATVWSTRHIIYRSDSMHPAQCFLCVNTFQGASEQLPPSPTDGCTQSLTDQTDGGGDVLRWVCSESLAAQLCPCSHDIHRQQSHQSEWWPLERIYMLLHLNNKTFWGSHEERMRPEWKEENKETSGGSSDLTKPYKSQINLIYHGCTVIIALWCGYLIINALLHML